MTMFCCRECGDLHSEAAMMRQHFIIAHGRKAQVVDVEIVGAQQQRQDFSRPARKRMHFT
jgi:hypothetical protein